MEKYTPDEVTVRLDEIRWTIGQYSYVPESEYWTQKEVIDVEDVYKLLEICNLQKEVDS